jgi:pimeloyl-ACP methyl ester carboxylesterase
VKGSFAVRLCAGALAGLLAFLAAPLCAQQEDVSQDKPVKAVGDKQFLVTGPEGSGTLRYFGTGSLDGNAQATRALIVIHGLLRNADEYERTGEAVLAAAQAAGVNTLLITPQFLAQIDVTAHGLPAGTLRWTPQTWNDGYPAAGPAPLSAYSALDAILLRLADRTRFPALREIVVAGHSAGGQMVQRYAVVGRAPDAVTSGPVAVRFVVANPSSYLYFDGERPHGDGFAPYDAAACPSYDHWKYGPDGPPPYVSGSITDLEGRYVARNVTYLL